MPASSHHGPVCRTSMSSYISSRELVGTGAWTASEGIAALLHAAPFNPFPSCSLTHFAGFIPQKGPAGHGHVLQQCVNIRHAPPHALACTPMSDGRECVDLPLTYTAATATHIHIHIHTCTHTHTQTHAQLAHTKKLALLP